MDAKSEKIALFRFGAIASLVLDCRAANLPAAPRRLLPVTSTFPLPNAPRFRSIHCWTGRSAIATAALKPWRRRPTVAGLEARC